MPNRIIKKQKNYADETKYESLTIKFLFDVALVVGFFFMAVFEIKLWKTDSKKLFHVSFLNDIYQVALKLQGRSC